MKESELKRHLLQHFPKENASCEWKEFKSLKHSVFGNAGNDIISYISAIANMEGGHLVIGIEDATLNIVGIQEFHNHTPDNIRQRILERCSSLDSEAFHVQPFIADDTNKTVWAFHIPKHRPRMPVYAHDKVWQRLDDSLIEMRVERLNSILAEPIDNSDWTAQIIDSATLDDLDPTAIALAREKFGEKHKNAPYVAEMAGWSNSTFLDKAKITIGGKVTRTALLLLGKAESSHLLPTLAQITWKLEGAERAYEHFGLPFLIATTQVLHRIRNLAYKIFPQDQLLATEVSKYDTRVVLEALNNCIAHQDYTVGARVVVTEQTDRLTFENMGSFYDGKPEDYFSGERTPSRYRNHWLTQAMVNLNMIDTVGDGIRTMTQSQRSRYFPLPDYHKSTRDKVVLEIYGHVMDENYTRLLLAQRDLPLTTVILLDRVQKKLPITDEAAGMLRKAGLIEGRKPNYFTSAQVAKTAGKQADYIHNKGFQDSYYKDKVIAYLQKYGSADRKQLRQLILDMLPAVLDEKQKANKVRNLLHAMSTRDKTIGKSTDLAASRWILTPSKDEGV